MKRGDVPKDVLQFVAERIDSVPHMEALLLLYEQPEMRWTTDLAAARLYVSPRKAAAILEDLDRHGLAQKRTDEGPAAYVYDGGWDTSGELMTRIAATYKLSLTTVVAYIHSRPSRSVREFARAFDIKKDP